MALTILCATFLKSLKEISYSTAPLRKRPWPLALQHFEVYLGSNSVPTTVFSDHNPLMFLHQQQQQSASDALVLVASGLQYFISSFSSFQDGTSVCGAV